MANRTQIVCLHEGRKGRSIDPVFINALIKGLNPPWLRPIKGSNHNKGSNLMRPVDCGGRKALIEKMPSELRACLNAGADTTLIVWAEEFEKIHADTDWDVNGDYIQEIHYFTELKIKETQK